MTWWTTLMVIAIVAILADVWKTRHRTRHGITKDMMGNEKPMVQPVNAELEREVVELRERIKVLERIATDANSVEGRHSRAIADEIEELRDR